MSTEEQRKYGKKHEISLVGSSSVVYTDGSTIDTNPTVFGQEEKETQDEMMNKKPSNAFIFLLIAAFLVTNVTAVVGRKLCLDSFGQHLAFFRLQLGVFMYCAWCGSVVLFRLLITKDITAAQRGAFPLYFFAGIGLCDGLSDFLSSVGGVHSPGSLQTLLSNLVIPFTMVLAYVVTKSRYTWIQVNGAVVILFGVTLATIPQFRHHGSEEGQVTYWYSIIVFALSVIPQAASIVFKDRLFKKGNLDVFYLSFLVSSTQLLLGWSFVPLQSIHALGGVPLNQIGGVMSDGARCFAGELVPKDRPAVNWTAAAVIFNSTGGVDDGVDRCVGAFVPAITLGYSLVGFLSGVIQLYIVKRVNASLAILVNAASLPLTNLAYSVPVFVGGAQNAAPFSVWNIAGLCVTLLGIVTYQSKELRRALCPSCLLSSEQLDDDDEDDDDGGRSRRRKHFVSYLDVTTNGSEGTSLTNLQQQHNYT